LKPGKAQIDTRFPRPQVGYPQYPTGFGMPIAHRMTKCSLRSARNRGKRLSMQRKEALALPFLLPSFFLSLNLGSSFPFSNRTPPGNCQLEKQSLKSYFALAEFRYCHCTVLNVLYKVACLRSICCQTLPGRSAVFDSIELGTLRDVR
jgi:hypothetical protein